MTSETSLTKPCIMCFTSIDARAKKCPQCRSLQGKYTNLENNPWVMGALGLVLVIVLGTLVNEIAFGYPKFESYAMNVKPIVTEFHIFPETPSPYVTCLGTIDNKTSIAWSDLKYEVTLFGADGKVVDTFAASGSDLVLFKNGPTHFRVRAEVAVSPSVVTHCVVNITHAESKR